MAGKRIVRSWGDAKRLYPEIADGIDLYVAWGEALKAEQGAGNFGIKAGPAHDAYEAFSKEVDRLYEIPTPEWIFGWVVESGAIIWHAGTWGGLLHSLPVGRPWDALWFGPVTEHQWSLIWDNPPNRTVSHG